MASPFRPILSRRFGRYGPMWLFQHALPHAFCRNLRRPDGQLRLRIQCPCLDARQIGHSASQSKAMWWRLASATCSERWPAHKKLMGARQQGCAGTQHETITSRILVDPVPGGEPPPVGRRGRTGCHHRHRAFESIRRQRRQCHLQRRRYRAGRHDFSMAAWGHCPLWSKRLQPHLDQCATCRRWRVCGFDYRSGTSRGFAGGRPHS